MSGSRFSTLFLEEGIKPSPYDHFYTDDSDPKSLNGFLTHLESKKKEDRMAWLSKYHNLVVDAFNQKLSNVKDSQLALSFLNRFQCLYLSLTDNVLIKLILENARKMLQSKDIEVKTPFDLIYHAAAHCRELTKEVEAVDDASFLIASGEVELKKPLMFDPSHPESGFIFPLLIGVKQYGQPIPDSCVLVLSRLLTVEDGLRGLAKSQLLNWRKSLEEHGETLQIWFSQYKNFLVEFGELLGRNDLLKLFYDRSEKEAEEDYGSDQKFDLSRALLNLVDQRLKEWGVDQNQIPKKAMPFHSLGAASAAKRNPSGQSHEGAASSGSSVSFKS